MQPISLKKIFIAFTALLFSVTLQAQKNLDDDHENFFRFGAKGGVNINKISGQSYNKGLNYYKHVGRCMQFNFSRVFGLQPELNFVQSQSEFTKDANSVFEDFMGGTQHKAKLNSLEIPLLLNINVGPSKRVKLQVGPSYSILKQSADSIHDNGDIFKKGEVSAIAGIWFQLPFVNLSARYKAGLTDVTGINSLSGRNQAIQVSLGVTF
ncbi:MAG: porin family protein [Ferruginibacter sp.]